MGSETPSGTERGGEILERFQDGACLFSRRDYMLNSDMGPGKCLHLASVKALNVMPFDVPVQFPLSQFKMQLQNPFILFWCLPMFNPSQVTSTSGLSCLSAP